MTNDYNGRRVLVTGGAGFLGSELVSQLCAAGANVAVLDDLTSGLLENIPDNAQFLHGDVRNFEQVRKAVEGREIIFHLAAQPFIPSCYSDPRLFVEVNVMGTMNVMLAALRPSKPVVVHASSSEVYGGTSGEKMPESFPMTPYSSYATSKVAAERLCFTLSREHDIPAIIARPFNIYGPRDTHPRIIPTIISQLSRSNVVRLGNTGSGRDFTYVSDVARGLLDLALAEEAVGETMNIGSEKAYKVMDLVNLISKLLDKPSVEIVSDPKLLRPLDPNLMVADTSKIRRTLGWRPEIPMEEGLKKTIEWYNGNGKRWAWEYKPQIKP